MADAVGVTSAAPAVPHGVATLAAAGVLDRFDVQLVCTVGRLVPAASELELLAVALVSRATRAGHVCVELSRLSEVVGPDDATEGVDDLDWPTPEEWTSALASSPLVAPSGSAASGPLRPLVEDGGRLYLQRFWSQEVFVAAQLEQRRTAASVPIGGPGTEDGSVDRVLDDLFGPAGLDGDDLQRVAAGRALRFGVTVIAGGPGTGKTHTVARILAAAHLLAERGGTDVRVALAAPTGKAAMRMRTAVRTQVVVMAARGLVTSGLAGHLASAEPSTIHRLLIGTGSGGHDPDASRYLPYDLIVVDETSMVSLPLMAKLLAAVRPDARLVLVGDPFQLASIEAGTVMDDVVGPGVEASGDPGATLAGRVTVLSARHRFEEDSGIALLADAVRSGNVSAAFGILAEGRADVAWLSGDDTAGIDELRTEVIGSSVRVARAALDGRAEDALGEAERVKVLAAIRFGPLGRFDWSDRIERAVARALPDVPGLGRVRVGTPIMITGNDRANGLFNGDVGVLVQTEDGPRVAVAYAETTRLLPLARIGRWETWWAMTIHKSQGSEFGHAVVSLPTIGSRILTRELLYTAVTRAKHRVTVVGTEEAVRAAIERPVARASGLRNRLWPGG